MKILLDPIYTNRELVKCSNYYKYEKTVKYILSKRDDVIFYFLIPAGDDWDRNGIFEHPNIQYVEVTVSRDRWNQYYQFPNEYLNFFTPYGEYGDWDALITGRVPLIPAIRAMAYFNLRTPERFIGVYDDLPIMGFKSALELWNKELQEKLTVNGFLESDYPMVFAEHERKGVLKEAANLLSFSELNKLHDKLKVGSVYLNMEIGNVPVGDELKVVYIQRLDKTERRPEEVFKSFFYLFAKGNNKYKDIVCDVYTNSQNVSFYSSNPEYSFINFYALDRDSYYEKLKTSNIFVSMSIDEGFPLAVFEALVKGSVGLIYRAAWSEAMLGKDYPFFVNNVTEVVAFARGILENWDENYKKFNDWRDVFLRKKIEDSTLNMPFHEEMFSEIERFVSMRKFGKNNVAEAIHDWATKNSLKEIDLNVIDLKKEGVCHGRIFPDIDKSFRWMENDYDLTRLNLISLGWEDGKMRGQFKRK